MKHSRGTLEAILWFNGLTAVIGGIGLAGGGANPPLEWLEGTPFSSYLIPGLLLLIVVGGSSLAAALALRRRSANGPLWGLVAGVIMLGWIAGEIIAIKQFSWLQAVYVATGLAAAGLSLSALSGRDTGAIA